METKNKFKAQMVYVIKELILTFGNTSTIFASKKLERFAILISMLSMTLLFLSYRVSNCQNFSSTDLMIVVAGWLGYAGFNVIQGRKDKLTNNEITNKNNTDNSDTNIQ